MNEEIKIIWLKRVLLFKIVIVALLFGLKSLGQIAGVTNVGYATGAMIGPLMAGTLYDLTGSYRIFFYVIALVAAIGFFLTLALNQNSRKR